MVDVVVETKLSPASPRRLKRVVLALLSEQRIARKKINSRVCLVFTTHQRLRALKRQHWGEDASTDVLSFPQWEMGDAFVPPHLGDIVISVPTARKQAVQHQHSLETELLILAAHGLTHLLGYDHEQEKDWQPFLKMQSRALSLLGEK